MKAVKLLIAGEIVTVSPKSFARSSHEIFISRVLAIIKIRSISHPYLTYPLPRKLSSAKKGPYIEKLTEVSGIVPTTYYYRKHSNFFKKRNPV